MPPDLAGHATRTRLGLVCSSWLVVGLLVAVVPGPILVGRMKTALLARTFGRSRIGYLRTMAEVARRRGAVLALLAVGGLLVGCGEGSESAAADAAEQFVQAVESGDGEVACGLLAPAARSELEQSSGQPCSQAILEEDISGGSEAEVTVFETMAQVKFVDQAVFLSRSGAGWLVSAAACRPVPDKPYDCSIKGS